MEKQESAKDRILGTFLTFQIISGGLIFPLLVVSAPVGRGLFSGFTSPECSGTKIPLMRPVPNKYLSPIWNLFLFLAPVLHYFLDALGKLRAVAQALNEDRTTFQQ